MCVRAHACLRACVWDWQVSHIDYSSSGGQVTLFHDDQRSTMTGLVMDLRFSRAFLVPGSEFGTAVAVSSPFVAVASKNSQVRARLRPGQLWLKLAAALAGIFRLYRWGRST
jgi:hypothetical protein